MGKYLPAGDRALLVEFSNTIDLNVNRRVHSLNFAISQIQPRGVEECIPTYRSLLIYYDPLETSYERLVFQVKDLEENLTTFDSQRRKHVVEVPVVYGGKFGYDFGFVAKYHNLTSEDVIQLHSNKDYTVYMLGFLAGFPYLGEVADEIVTPRLNSPRLRVPRGSVGIAGKQTGIYPYTSPGGWRIIGRTTLKLFDPANSPPTSLQPGDTVRFKPIEEDVFKESWGN